MARYASFFSYSSETWARMINAPGDRTAALRQTLDSVGGSLESIHWMFGPYDGIAILDVPDSVSAAAVSVAVSSTGVFTHMETHELFTQEQLGETLAKARNVTQAYQRPGQQG
jgi:uncharacterized protein with GYD domain